MSLGLNAPESLVRGVCTRNFKALEAQSSGDIARYLIGGSLRPAFSRILKHRPLDVFCLNVRGKHVVKNLFTVNFFCIGDSPVHLNNATGNLSVLGNLLLYTPSIFSSGIRE